MSPDEYVATQLRLECIGFDRNGRFCRIPGPDPDDLGRVYTYRHESGYRLYVRDDVSDAIYAALQGMGAETAFEDPAAVRSVVAREGPCDEVTRWRTYRLTMPDPAIGSGAITLTAAHQPLMDAYHPGMALGEYPILAAITKTTRDADVICATCVSIRENAEAAESYVFTDPAWRRQGYGRQVTAAWATGVLDRSKVPFYSHLLTNTASARLLQSLPASFCFEGMVFA